MRVVAGPERRTRVLAERDRRIAAWHEAGHAIDRHDLQDDTAARSISIIPRGRHLSHTLALPTEERSLATRANTRGHDGGGAGRPGGGGPDVRRRDDGSVRRPRGRHRDSEKDGHALRDERHARPRVFGHAHKHPFVGREPTARQDCSEQLRRDIDHEIRDTVETAYRRAEAVLSANRGTLASLPETLLVPEKLDRARLGALLDGNDEQTVSDTPTCVRLGRGPRTTQHTAAPRRRGPHRG